MTQQNPLSIKPYLNLLLEKRKTFLIIITITAFVSVFISFLIPPKFKTIAVVYPIHLSPYSEESQTEQLLQFLNSIYVRDVVIKKLNLIQHYGIDTSKNDYRSLLHYLYRENISFSPTLYESIEIEVKDKNPNMCKKIADCIIQTTDSFIMASKRNQVYSEYSNFENETKKIQHRIDSLNNIIVRIQNEYDIIDASGQAKYISKALAEGKTATNNQKLIDALKNKKQYIQSIENEIKAQIKSLGNILKEKDRLEVDLHGQLSFIQIVSPPYVPDKKYFPVRWIIVALSELAVVSIFFIYILYIHSNQPKN